MNKRAAFDEFMDWPEVLWFLMLLLGLLFAFTVQSAFVSYLVLLIVAFAFGRMIYLYVELDKIHLYLLVFGFIIGYLVAGQTDFRIALALFIFGILFSYYAHKDKWIPMLK